ncbi:MAG: peptidoglycan-associated lipoprotein Pal [Kiloniellales bacterium]|nr:peptidoglycan-associated lipoprotein Pal [Kiloniellales bacterium]
MRFKVLSMFAALLLLAACETPTEETTASTSSAATTPSTPAAPTEAVGIQPGSLEDLIDKVGDRVFFDFDKYDLKPEGRSTVEALAAWLNSFPAVTLTLEGHADERGTREYNLALGERRANAVKDYLIALGINAGRLTTISYGEERPAVPGSYEEAWAQNRRSQFVVN